MAVECWTTNLISLFFIPRAITPPQQNQIFSEIHTPTFVTEYQQEGCLCDRFTGRFECQPHSQVSSFGSQKCKGSHPHIFTCISTTNSIQCRVSSKMRYHPFIHPSSSCIFHLRGCARGVPGAYPNCF